MTTIEFVHRGLVVLVAMLLATPAPADEGEAQASTEAPEERIGVLEEQIGILAEELDALRKSVALPEDAELVSIYGFGPAASKIYQKERGLSIGSYGELRFRAFVDDADEQTNIYDAVRAVLYLGYKFNDWILVNSEFEFEHGGTGGGGSVSVEFLNVDFLLHENANARVGLLLIPMGFINELHEPTTYFGAERPVRRVRGRPRELSRLCGERTGRLGLQQQRPARRPPEGQRGPLRSLGRRVPNGRECLASRSAARPSPITGAACSERT